jgi:hypothetical protein
MCSATITWKCDCAKIREKRGEYSLIMRLEPPGIIRIDRLNMCYKGLPISLGTDGAINAGTNIFKEITCSGENGLAF